MQTFIYSRQSSGSNDQSVSIDQQVDNCKALAKKEGLTVTKVFEEYNCSGRLFPPQLKSLAEMDSVYQDYLKETKKVGQERTQLGLLLDRLKKGDIIIVDDKTRFMRSLNGSYLENALIQILKNKQIKLISCKEGTIDFNSFTDQFVFNLQSSINSNQLETQRQKSKASLKRLKDSGEYSASLGTAVGYKYSGRKREIEVDKTNAPIVPFVFEQYLKGNSLLSICREINKKWGRNVVVRSIKNILNRVEYTGFMYDSDNNLIKCKQTEGKELVDFQLWQQAQNLLNSRKNQKFQLKKYPNHFTSMLKCGVCGSVLKICINNHGKYFSFRCMNHTIRNQPNCKVSITSNTLYSNGLSLEDAVSPLLIIGLLKKLQANPSKDKDVLAEKQIQLQNLITSEQKLTEMFLSGLLDSSVYETNLKQQKEKKQTLQQEIINLEQNLKEDDSEKIRSLVNKIVARKLTYEQYQELIPYSIKDIVVFEDRVIVNTVEGPVELKRFREHGVIKLYNYIWSNMPPHFKIIYYRDKPNIYLPMETLLKTNYLKIQQIVHKL